MTSTIMISLIILAIMIILLMLDKIPISIVTMACCVAFIILGISPTSTAFSGFSSDVIMMVFGTMLVGDAVFEVGLADYLGVRIVKMVGNNEKKLLLTVVAIAGILSAFFSNTAVAAMFIPLVGTAAAMSGGKIKRKHLVMAVGYTAVAGGSCTLIGSTPNILGQGILQDMGLKGMSMFGLAYAGIPKLLLLFIYYATFGYYLTKKICESVNDPFDEETAKAPQQFDLPKVMTTKMKIMMVILILFIFGFATQIYSVGTVSIICSILVLLTKCIEPRKAFAKLDWTTIIIIGSVMGVASCLEESGTTAYIAEKIVSLMGDEPNILIFVCIMIAVPMFFGNLISHVGAAAITMPIFISVGSQLGLDPTQIVMCIINSISIAYLTPISTGPLTMTLQAGYRFKDYVKIGFPIAAASYILMVVLYARVFI